MSNIVKWDPILDQFSMIARPYTKLNGLKLNHTLSSSTYLYSQLLYGSTPQEIGQNIVGKIIVPENNTLMKAVDGKSLEKY